MSRKQLTLGLVAIACMVAAIVIAIRASDDRPVDQAIASVKETFTCTKCGATMELTVAQQAEMLRKKDGKIICASCGQEGPQKRVLVRVSGSDLLQSEEPNSVEQDEESSDSRNVRSKEPPSAAGVRSKKSRNR